MNNPVMESHKRLDAWFVKVENLLTENFEVIGKLLVPKKIQEDDDVFTDGSN